MTFPDHPDFGKERPSYLAFETLLSRLSPTPDEVIAHPERLSKMKPEQVDINEIRTSLKEAGHRMEITREEILILKEPQFRGLNQGRGRAVNSIVGPSRGQELMSYIYALTLRKQNRIVSSETGLPIEGSQGRGLRHFVADTFLLVADPSYLDRYCATLNQRSLKGLLTSKEIRIRPELQETIRKVFPGVEDMSKTGKFISVPPGTLTPTWQFLTAKWDRY